MKFPHANIKNTQHSQLLFKRESSKLISLTNSTSAIRQDLMWFLTKLTQSFSVIALSWVPITYMSCGMTPSICGSRDFPVPLHRNQLLMEAVGWLSPMEENQLYSSYISSCIYIYFLSFNYFSFFLNRSMQIAVFKTYK